MAFHRGLIGFLCLPLALAGGLFVGCGDSGDHLVDYNVDIAVTSQSRFGALQFDITALENGDFIGHSDKVECVALVDAIIAANNFGDATVKIGMISLQGIATPSVILRCGFRSGGDITPASFEIEVRDASDTNSEPLDPVPTVVVQSVSSR